MKQLNVAPKSVQVQYFAFLREQRGRETDTVTTTAATPQDLYVELQAAHGLSLPASVLSVALNGQYDKMDSPLRDGDRVVFIQPVAGG